MVVFVARGHLTKRILTFLCFFFVGPRADLDLYRCNGVYLSFPNANTSDVVAGTRTYGVSILNSPS